MLNLYQLYVTVTDAAWSEFFSAEYPNAPEINTYRVLVLTNVDYAEMQKHYDIKELTAQATIEELELNTDGMYMSTLEDIKEISAYFDPPENVNV